VTVFEYSSVANVDCGNFEDVRDILVTPLLRCYWCIGTLQAGHAVLCGIS